MAKKLYRCCKCQKPYDKLSSKEQQRHYDYQYNQTARQEELLLKHEKEKLIREKLDSLYKEQENKTEKEREVDEIYKKLEAMAKVGVE